MATPEEVHARILRNMLVVLEVSKQRSPYQSQALLKETYETLAQAAEYMEAQGITRPKED